MVCVTCMKFVAQLSELKVAETYIKLIEIFIPWKATLNYHNIFFAKFYKQGGVMSMVAPDLDSAWRACEWGMKMPFRMTDELVEVWCEWAEMEICNKWVFLGATFGVISDSILLRNYDEAIHVMQWATSVPKNTKISYHDQVHLIDYAISSVDLFLQSLPSQVRLFKLLKLQSYYVDLEESIGTVETTKWVYNQILGLCIANAQVLSEYNPVYQTPCLLQCISEALPCTLTHCVSDSACYATLHRPLHLHLHTCCLHLFVCLFVYLCYWCMCCLFVCLFPLLDCFH